MSHVPAQNHPPAVDGGPSFDELRPRLDPIVARYPVRAGAMLPVLWVVQRARGGWLSPRSVNEVAAYLEVPQAHVEGVISFYTMFKGHPVGRNVAMVCKTLSCRLRGAQEVIDALTARYGVELGGTSADGHVTIETGECLGLCDMAPCMLVGDERFGDLTPKSAVDALEGLASMSAPEFPRLLKGAPPIGRRETLDEYVKRGGYETLKKALGMKPEDITKAVLDSGLRGRGGAGFPAGRKWTFVPKNTGKQIYLAVNGDESEPGCFKDRQIMERVPHLLVEGAVIACRAIGANTAYIYIRGEYPHSIKAVEAAIEEARKSGHVGANVMGSGWKCDVWAHSGAGAYICGEETGMLSSIEGGRGYPKIKPPFPAVEGLWRCPTIINNVETIANVVPIVRDGADEWKKAGDADTPGTRLVGISGHVNRPCHVEIDPAKTTLKQLIYDHAGGIWKGRKLKAVIPGGSSVPVLTASMIDVPFTFGAVKTAGSLAGAAGVIVMDETTCMVDALLNLMEFYHHESCGQCTPCREGTGWLQKLVARIESGHGKPGDVDLLDRVADTVGGATAGKTICFLADSAVMPTKSFLQHFRADFVAHIGAGGCPFKKTPVGATA